MAQDIVIAGETFYDVPAIQIPKAGHGGIAKYEEKKPSLAPVDDGVNFIDFDGTIVWTWNADEIETKTELPRMPDHSDDQFEGSSGIEDVGLVSDGWNWTLEEIKNYASAVPGAPIFVGACYHPNDNAVRIFIELQNGALNPILGLGVNGTARVDWGDGTESEVTGTSISSAVYTPHAYAQAGRYVIRIFGTVRLGGASNKLLTADPTLGENYNYIYSNAVSEIHLAQDTGSSGSQRFLQNLQKIVFPLQSSFSSGSLFWGNYSLQAIVYPRGVNSVYNLRDCRSVKYAAVNGNSTGNFGNYIFGDCESLNYFTFRPATRTYQEYGFTNCYSLKKVVLPETTTELLWIAFSGCRSLAEFVVPKLVVEIKDNALAGLYGLKALRLKPLQPPVVNNINVFSGLPTSCVIYVPTGTLEAYRTATNYPDPTVYTYMEE